MPLGRSDRNARVGLPQAPGMAACGWLSRLLWVERDDVADRGKLHQRGADSTGGLTGHRKVQHRLVRACAPGRVVFGSDHSAHGSRPVPLRGRGHGVGNDSRSAPQGRARAPGYRPP